jgi:hypothetical protein
VNENLPPLRCFRRSSSTAFPSYFTRGRPPAQPASPPAREQHTPASAALARALHDARHALCARDMSTLRCTAFNGSIAAMIQCSPLP